MQLTARFENVASLLKATLICSALTMDFFFNVSFTNYSVSVNSRKNIGIFNFFLTLGELGLQNTFIS